MNKTKLIIHERFNGKQSLEEVFLSAFQSWSAVKKCPTLVAHIPKKVNI